MSAAYSSAGKKIARKWNRRIWEKRRGDERKWKQERLSLLIQKSDGIASMAVSPMKVMEVEAKESRGALRGGLVEELINLFPAGSGSDTQNGSHHRGGNGGGAYESGESGGANGSAGAGGDIRNGDGNNAPDDCSDSNVCKKLSKLRLLLQHVRTLTPIRRSQRTQPVAHHRDRIPRPCAAWILDPDVC